MIDGKSNINMDLRTSATIGSSPQSMSSSPAIPKDPHAENIRSKKAPSVTPRRFRRFFTPRTAPVHSQGFSAARQALRDITSPALNRGGQTTEHRRALGPFRDLVSFGDENATAVITRNGKRRKVLPTPEPLSTSSTPTKRRRTCPDTFVLVDDPGDASITVGLSTPPAVEDEDEDETTDDARRPLGRKAFVRFSEASVGARVLRRSMGELGSGLQAMHCARILPHLLSHVPLTDSSNSGQRCDDQLLQSGFRCAPLLDRRSIGTCPTILYRQLQ